MKKLIPLLLLVLSFGFKSTRAQLSINADLSPRAELRHGYRTLPSPDDKAAASINQRSRLILSHKYENLITHFSFQDVRIWGQESQKQTVPSLAIHEAWAELLFSDKLSLKVGRQALRYDNQRFLSFNDWIPMGQKHDAALLKMKSTAGEVHIGGAFNQASVAFGRNFETIYGVNNYKYLTYLWYKTHFAEDASLSLLGIYDGYEATDETSDVFTRGTWSAFFEFKLGETTNLIINPALQHGKTPSNQDIQALYFRTELSTKPADKIRSTMGIEIFSGNDPDDNTRFRAFNPTYGAGHANSGHMDYFTNYPAHTRGAGLVNPFLKNNYSVNQKVNFGADLHLFFIQNDFLNNGEEINKYLGTEIDLTLSYAFNPFTKIISGFHWMFGSESMEIIKNGSSNEPAYFAYVMLRIRPKLL
jgi:hypothetical protein